MTLDTFEALGHDLTAPRYSVAVGDRTIDETSGLVRGVTVDRTIDGADHFSLSLGPRFDHEAGAFADFDLDELPVGEAVTIAVGYGAELETVLDGSITEHGTEFPASGAPSVTVSGYGRYHALTRDVVEEHWEDRTDAEIVRALAEAYDLAPAVDDTPIRYPTVENERESDAEFLERKLAPRNDDGNGPFEVFALLDTLVFRAPRDDRDPGLELAYGESLRSFSPSYTEARSPARVEVRGWNPRRKAEVVGVAEADAGGAGERVVRRSVQSEQEAERIARSILHRSRNERLRGTAETVGLPEVEIGRTIELSGLGATFSGTYYVEAVTHAVDTGGFTTSFTVRLPNREGSP
jgi:hypothetical protein